MPSRTRSRSAVVQRTLQARADVLFDLTATLPQLVEVDVAAIVPNPDQPRKKLDEEGLVELAQSIEAHGLLQPIVIQDLGEGRYMLVAGQRRLVAHQRLRRERIPALLTTGKPDELALIENLQREALPPLDEAEALAVLQQRYGYTQDQLARTMAKAKSTISELLSLNALPLEIKEEIRTSERPISKSLLIEVARLGEPGLQLAFWRRLGRQSPVTVREARASKHQGADKSQDEARQLVRTGKRFLTTLTMADPERIAADAELVEILQRLRARLDAVLPSRCG